MSHGSHRCVERQDELIETVLQCCLLSLHTQYADTTNIWSVVKHVVDLSKPPKSSHFSVVLLMYMCYHYPVLTCRIPVLFFVARQAFYLIFEKKVVPCGI